MDDAGGRVERVAEAAIDGFWSAHEPRREEARLAREALALAQCLCVVEDAVGLGLCYVPELEG